MADSPTEKPRNPYRLGLRTFRFENGLTDPEVWTDQLGEWTFDGVCPALCTEGCEVEPDGRCEHDCPSVLLVLGLV